MGYQSGTATGPTDLLSKLRTFLLAEGWTVNLWDDDGTGKRLHVQKTVDSGGPTMYFNFRSAVSETGTTITADNTGSTDGTVTGIILNGSTGYDAGEAWHEQPGYPQNPGLGNKSFGNVMSPMSISAIPAYYFFSVGDTVNCVVEITSGKFQFMSFGCLEKQGAYSGGQFFSGSLTSYSPYSDYSYNYGYTPCYFTFNNSNQPHGAVYVDMDATARWRIARGSVTPDLVFPAVAGCSYVNNAYYARMGLASMFYKYGPNFYNSIAAMCPIYILGQRSDDNHSLLGWPAGVRHLNCTNYSAGQEVTYGTETWKIFHADSIEDVMGNMYCGFAFLKET